MTKEVRAGGAFVEVYGIDEKLTRTLTAAQARLRSFAMVAQASLKTYGESSMLAGAAGQAGAVAILGPLAAATKAFADAGSALDDMSQRTGVSVETLSGLGWSAKMAGTELDQVEVGLRNMAKLSEAAARGEAGAVAELARLGIAAKDFVALAPDERFALLADKVAAIEDPASRTAVAMQLFGKAGANLMPLLAKGSAGFAEMHAEAERLGLVMSQKDATAAAELGDSLDRVESSAGGLANTIGAALAPAMTGVLNSAAAVIGQAAKWITENRSLVVQIAGTAAAVFVAGSALVALGAVLYGTSVALGVVAGAGSAAIAAIGAVGGALAFVFSPAGLAVAALAGGAYVLFQTLQAGLPNVSGLLAGFADTWGIVRDETAATFEAITAALSAGDINAAAELLWLQLQSIWLAGTAPLRETWYAVRDAMVVGLITATAAIESAWLNMTTNMLQAWNSMQQALLPLISSAQNTLADYIAQAGEALGVFGEGTFETLQEDQQRRAGELAKRLTDLTAENARLETERQAALKEIAAAATTDRDAVANRTAEQQAELSRKIAETQSRLNAAREKAVEKTPAKALEETAKKAQQGLTTFESKANNTALELGSIEALRAVLAATTGGRTIESELAKQTDLAEEQADTLASIDDRLRSGPTVKVERVA